MFKGARTRQCGAACIIVRGKTPFDPDIMIIKETTALSDAVRYVYMKVTLELRQ